MMKPFFKQGPALLAALMLAGCAGAPIQSRIPLPDSNSGFHDIWAYAASLEEKVKTYAGRRWRNYPDGLRKAVARSRMDFMTTGKVTGAVADLQSYLFFEYRRQKGLDASVQPGKPHPATTRYVRTLLIAIHEKGG